MPDLSACRFKVGDEVVVNSLFMKRNAGKRHGDKGLPGFGFINEKYKLEPSVKGIVENIKVATTIHASEVGETEAICLSISFDIEGLKIQYWHFLPEELDFFDSDRNADPDLLEQYYQEML